MERRPHEFRFASGVAEAMATAAVWRKRVRLVCASKLRLPDDGRRLRRLCRRVSREADRALGWGTPQPRRSPRRAAASPEHAESVADDLTSATAVMPTPKAMRG
jgi:hypothetical protein